MKLMFAFCLSCLAVSGAVAQDQPKPPQNAETAQAGQNPAGQNPAGQNPAGQDPAGQDPAGQDLAGQDLADIMVGTQMRHLKLSYAGSNENWPLAAFEVGRMRKSFDAAAKYFPVYDHVAVADLIAKFSEPALAEVSKAIADKNGAGFLKSFGKLTDACNSCHQAAGFGFIKIRAPTASPFSNQAFAPASK